MYQWKEFQTKPIDPVLYEYWKKIGLFDKNKLDKLEKLFQHIFRTEGDRYSRCDRGDNCDNCDGLWDN